MSSVVAFVLASDDRLWESLLGWRPPGWIRLWMLGASRLADRWLWPATAVSLLALGREGFRALAAAAVAATVANGLQLFAKRRVRRARPCERARPLAFDVALLGWFPSDRFSFPSGHALNAFAVGCVVALAFPAAAVPVLALASSIAISRVVMGLHWLSDVLAGALVGALIGALAFLTFLR